MKRMNRDGSIDDGYIDDDRVVAVVGYLHYYLIDNIADGKSVQSCRASSGIVVMGAQCAVVIVRELEAGNGLDDEMTRKNPG